MSDVMKLDTKGFDHVIKALRDVGERVKPIANEALKATFEIVTEKAEASAVPAKYPRGGKYSTGDTAKSLIRTPKIKWKGTSGSVEVGFDLSNGGLASIFLMYGTPKMAKVQEMYDAFYGDQTIGEVELTQQQIFFEALEKYL